MNAKQVADWIDLAHLPLVLIWILLALLPWTRRLGLWITLVVTSTQIVCFGCPLTLLSAWLRNDYSRFDGSLTHLAYMRLGRWWGSLVLVAAILLADNYRRWWLGFLWPQMAGVSRQSPFHPEEEEIVAIPCPKNLETSNQ
jgi:hypothetical protein